MPEQQRNGISEHEQYGALCALAAGGLLEGAEFVDFQAHIKECSQCRFDYRKLSSLVTRELPQAEGAFRQRLAEMRAKPLPGWRQRLLERARSEGVVFSREGQIPAASGRSYLRLITALAPVAAVVVFAVSLGFYHFRKTQDTLRAGDAASAQQIAELRQEISALTANLSQLNESVAAGQRENQNLRAQLGAGNQRRDQGETERSSSRNAQLLGESRNQEKLLAEAKDEVASVNQLRINDEASLVEQQVRITELSDKLRIASATLDMERQLAAAGKDVPELMAARQLHVIDVRDTDPNGNQSKAFGRVFLTEGKSLTFYAFDLNEDAVLNAKHSFQVWATPEANRNSARSLGFLRVDAKGQGRWVLKVDNPDLVKKIGSVFVTVEPAAGGKKPSGQKMLSAYLGEANHP